MGLQGALLLFENIEKVKTSVFGVLLTTWDTSNFQGTIIFKVLSVTIVFKGTVCVALFLLE